jgi:hypothetical protein
MKRDQRTVITLVTVFAALAIPMRLQPAAQNQPQAKTQPPGSTVATANYNFLIGSGLLCNSDDSTACPAVAKAANGNTIEISGAGTLNGRSVTAAGAFTQKTPTEDIVATGVWAATELESFESYGLAPGALQVDYPKLRAFGPFATGLGKMARPMAGMMAGPVAAGGVAVIRIRLLPDAGSPAEAVLQVNCAKGKVPADAQSDGARLTITGGPAFDEQVSGRAIFLLQRPGPNFAWSGK